MAPELKDEELVVGETTFTKSDVKAMDDGEFEHALALARQQGTVEGDEQVETLNKWRGKSVKSDDDKA